MASKQTELAIIGAGPAGISAAVSAAKAGVIVTIIDEYPKLGGQYLRGAHHPHPVQSITATEKLGRERLTDLTDLPSLPITILSQTLVWGIENHTLFLHGPDSPDQIEAETILLATGARERVLPFPGWTLPGVMTLGAAQILAKEHGIAPGKRILVAGTGPLLLATAAKLAQIPGAEVVGILEATRPWRLAPHAPALAGNWDRLHEGWHYLQTLVKAKIPYRFGYAVISAEGDAHLQGVTVARLNQSGEPILSSQERLPIDTLCLGFGFLPNTALSQIAGCQLVYVPQRGGWITKVNENMATTQPGIYAAGESTGVEGAKAALVEGEIAGFAIARNLGHLNEADFQARMATLRKRLKPLRRFGNMLNTAFSPPKGLHTITTDNTILCRCEEVTAGEVRQAIHAGAATLGDLKNWIRVGQGPCQGRTCGTLLAQQIALETGQRPQDADYFRARPPVKPVTLESLATL